MLPPWCRQVLALRIARVTPAVPSAVWINPPANDVDRSRAEHTMTQESRKGAIVDPGASCEAVLAADRPESPDLIPEDLCMAVAQ